jgi:hypothetical protein
MADPNQTDSDKLKLLELQNKQLRDQIKLLQDVGSISSKYIDRLYEIKKIRENILRTEETSVNISKQMQNALRNHNTQLESTKSIEEQIKKNKELTTKAIKEQGDLQSKLNAVDQNGLKDIDQIKSK